MKIALRSLSLAAPIAFAFVFGGCGNSTTNEDNLKDQKVEVNPNAPPPAKNYGEAMLKQNELDKKKAAELKGGAKKPSAN